MVKIGLQISCAFENVEELRPGPGHSYYLKLRCMNCGECDDIWHDGESNNLQPFMASSHSLTILVCEDEKVKQDSRNAKGYNFVIKCKLCSRESSMDVVEGSLGNKCCLL